MFFPFHSFLSQRFASKWMILDNRNDCDQVKNDVSHRQWGKNSGFHSFLSFPAFLLRGGEKAAYLTCRGTSSRGKNFHCQANATFHFSLEETILLKVNIFWKGLFSFSLSWFHQKSAFSRWGWTIKDYIILTFLLPAQLKLTQRLFWTW